MSVSFPFLSDVPSSLTPSPSQEETHNAAWSAPIGVITSVAGTYLCELSIVQS